MPTESVRNVETSTSSGVLTPSDCFEDDEMYAYIEITELLIAAPKQQITVTSHNPQSTKPANKNLTLPMRKSLFAHVPPFIIFRSNSTTDKLPPVITKHLLWWRAKKSFPRIISSTVTKSGFHTTTKHASNWCGTWCDSVHVCSQLQHTHMFCKVNLFPSSVQFSNKILLWRNFHRMRTKHGSKHFNFMPWTFILPEERSYLKKHIQKNGGIWILKPPSSCAGHGIKLISRFYDIPNGRSLIAQRYITKPRLIDGIKFDIRLYVLLTSIDPLRLYVYNDGLVRLATVKYVSHVNTLYNKFMHLTNTSVNKRNPNFEPNDDPMKRRGNMWSLSCLWKYLSSVEDVDPISIWTKIKDIAVKTVISSESFLVDSWKKNSMSTYNYYQLFGFDILLDQQCHPWLLEVNTFPSMQPDTPLCRIVKCQLVKDYLNLVGYHVPNVLTGKELRILRRSYKENTVCYNQQLYSSLLTWADKRKQCAFSKLTNRKEYLKPILKSLTPGDVRVLIRHEDEIARTGRFEKIFPTCKTYRYLEFFDEVRYYNLLLDAWENEYGDSRSRGIERLRKLCRKKFHLT